MSIIYFVNKERAYLRSFSFTQKNLLLSFFFYMLSAPVVTIFNNTFIWRQNESPIDIAFYNLGIYFGVALGFVLTLFCRRYFSTVILYAFGCLLQGLAPISLFFFRPQTFSIISLAGVFLGIALGFLWANRNTLTSEATEGPRRFAFVSIESVINTFVSIFLPALLGYIIVSSETKNWFSSQTTYEIIGTSAFIFLFLAALTALQTSLSKERLNHLHLFIKQAKPFWNKLRLLELLSGFVHGFEILLPLLFILTFLGVEDTVGMVKSATAIIAALCMYTIGKIVQHKDHVRLFFGWLIGTSLAAVIFAVLFNAQGVLLYFLFFGFASAFRWPSLVTIMYECVDLYKNGSKINRFSLLLDRELFLNIGRIFSISIFILLYNQFPIFTFRFGMLALIGVEILLFILLKDLVRHVMHANNKTTIPLEEPL